MKPGRPRDPQERERAKADVRARILTAARELVLRDGFENLSMRKLANRVNYSPAAIYRYFPSLESLAIEICLEGYRELFTQMESAVAPKRDAEGQLRAVCLAYVQFGLANPKIYQLIFAEQPQYLTTAFQKRPTADQPDDPATECYQLLVRLTQAFLSRDGGIASRKDAITLAEVCWATMHGIVSLKLTCPGFPTIAADKLCLSALERLTC
jgi:AcrR family transcriptional regulator